MEIFNIVGRISAQYSEAVSNIQAVGSAADNAAENIGGLGDEAETTQESVEELGEETESVGESTDDTNESFTIWKGTLANLASDVIRNAISKVTELAKEIVGLGEDFTSTMSEVKAISGANDEEFEKLKETAREFGSKTVFSATESAEALKYMALAGWDTEQSTSALGGVLDLAAASGMELGQASDMVTDYLSAFGMEADKSAYFADMLAYAQSNSNTTAAQLGDAYGNCAASLNAAGQDVETVTALLEAMANQGLKGSEGGTALAATMRDITNAMSTVKDKTKLAQLAQSEFVSSTGDLNDLLGKNYIQMGKTLIPVSDAKGNFRDLTDILTDVSNATENMGDADKAAAMSNTFTSYSIKGVNLVLNEGIDKVAGYEEELRKADGAASDMAATMNDNLKGDLAGMNSAFDELKLKIFDGLEEPLRSAVQFITDKVVPALTALLQNFDSLLPGIAAVTTAIVTFKTVMAISSLINAVTTAFAAYKAANEGATVAQWLFNAAVGANPLVLLISLLAGLVVMFVVLWNKCDWFREFWINLWEKIKSGVQTAITAIAGFFTGAWEALNNFISDIIEFWAGVNQNIVETVTSTWNTIKEFFVRLWENIKFVFGAIFSWIDENIIAPVRIAFTNMWTSLKNGASEAWEGIKSVFGKVADFFKETFTKAWTKVKQVFSTGGKIFDGVKEGIVTAFKTVVNVIIKGINKVISIPFNTINGFLNKIKDASFLGISPFEDKWDYDPLPIPKIPELAKGGILPKGKTGYLEGDGAEAVVPLERNTEWTGRVANLITAKFSQSNDTVLLDKLTEIANLLKQKQSDGEINFTLRIDNFNNSYGSAVEDVSERAMTTMYEFIKRNKLGGCC